MLCVEETKLENSFLNSEFISKISNDRSSKGVGKLVYVRQGISLKRREKFENKTCETICIELFPKNGVLYFTQPPKQNNIFFDEISRNLNHIVNK